MTARRKDAKKAGEQQQSFAVANHNPISQTISHESRHDQSRSALKDTKSDGVGVLSSVPQDSNWPFSLSAKEGATRVTVLRIIQGGILCSLVPETVEDCLRIGFFEGALLDIISTVRHAMIISLLTPFILDIVLTRGIALPCCTVLLSIIRSYSHFAFVLALLALVTANAQESIIAVAMWRSRSIEPPQHLPFPVASILGFAATPQW